MNHRVQWSRHFSGLNLPEMSQMRHVLSPTPQSRKVRNKVQYSELFSENADFLDCALS